MIEPAAIYPDLRGKVAVVTGGSKGIGAATCELLVANGVKVAVVSRGQGPIDELVERLGADNAIGIAADGTEPAELVRVREETEERFGPVSLLAPFAGGFGAFTPVAEMPLDEWRKVIDDNLTSTFVATKAFLAGMLERGEGSIVTMSSISARFLDKPTQAAYAASKAGVIMFTRHLAQEVGEAGVRVNSVAPGTTMSERIERIMDEEAIERTKRLSPMNLMGMPEDTANATVFLLSDAARWLTGVTIDVNGGQGDAVSENVEGLEQELEGMLEIEKFSSPADFREHADWTDPAIYEEAAADPVAWWTARSKELLDWDAPPTEGLNDSNPPFYKWFEDGRINVSAKCLDRHVAAGLGERVAYHWRGEEGERRDVTYAELLDQTQRFANALKDLGVEKGDVVGIYLPMIPEVAVAMLACARIGAIHNVVFGGFSAESVRERMAFSEAKALVTVDGSRRKGKTAPIKAAVDEAMGDLESLEKIVVIRATGVECADDRGPRRLLRRGLRRPPTPSARPSRWRPSTRSSSSTPRARPQARRASCTRPAAT